MQRRSGRAGEKSDVKLVKPAYDKISRKRKRCASSEAFVWSDDVLRWRRDGTEGVISHDVDAAYIYRRSDGSGVSFVLLLLKAEDRLMEFSWYKCGTIKDMRS